MFAVVDVHRRERVRDIGVVSAWAVFWSANSYSHSHDLGAGLVGGIVGGLVQGIPTAMMVRHEYLQAFVVDGQPATVDERAAAVGALRSGQLPVDPRQREVAVSFARHQLGKTGLRLAGVILGLGTLAFALLGIIYSPWCWLVAGLCIVLGPAKIVSLRRRRQRARALLTTSALEPVGSRVMMADLDHMGKNLPQPVKPSHAVALLRVSALAFTTACFAVLAVIGLTRRD
jgi:hypothetical protein